MAQMISIINFSTAFKGRGKLDGIKTRYSITEADSIYRPNTNNAGQSLAENVWDAVLAYHKRYRNGAVAHTKKGSVAELDRSDGLARQLVFLERPSIGSITVQAACVSGTSSAPVISKTYEIANVLNQSGFRGTAVLLAMMPYILKDSEAKKYFDELVPFTAYDDNDAFWDDKNKLDEFGKALTRFTNNIYYRMKNPESTGSWAAHDGTVPGEFSLKLDVSNQGNIKSFTAKKLKQRLSDIHGKFIYVQNLAVEVVGEKYYLNPNMTPQEKAAVPVMPSWYKMQEWTIDFARRMHFSSKFPTPIRTGLLFGPAGTGKSEGCRALFSLLGLRHTLITCFDDMELMDFVGMLIPQGGDKPTAWIDIMREMGLPNTDDIMNNPAGSHIQLYKQNPPAILQKSIFDLPDMEKDEVRQLQDKMLRDMMNMCFGEISKRVSSGQYNYVEGPLIQACRNGWGIEVQEAGIIKRAGVVVGLNALLESGDNNMITLQTGEVIKKDPNTVIMFTSNDDYIGTTLLNQSVISRISLVQWFANPTIDEMVNRVQAQTGFNNKMMLTKMAKVIHKLSDACKDKDIRDGSIGLRELLNWTMVVMADCEDAEISPEDVTNEMVGDAAITTVLGKISQVCENIEEVVDAVMNATDFGVRSLRI